MSENIHEICSGAHMLATGQVKPEHRTEMRNLYVSLTALAILFACAYILLSWYAEAIGPSCRHPGSLEYAACSAAMYGDERQKRAARTVFDALY